EVAADEDVPGESFARGTECVGDADVFLHHGHMAALAAAGVAKVAVKPFLVGDLLGQLTDDGSVCSESFGDERVAGSAELGGADVLGFGWAIAAGRTPHDACLAGLDLVGAVLGAKAVACGIGIDNETANVAIAGAELV